VEHNDCFWRPAALGYNRLMLLVLHIISALSGIAMTSFSLISPSAQRLRISYWFVILTVVSGTVIIIKDHLSILSVCLSGLLYIGFTVSGLIAASHRLAKQPQSLENKM
jgi:hypothetical protein